MQVVDVFRGDAVTTTHLARHHPPGGDMRQCLDSVRNE